MLKLLRKIFLKETKHCGCCNHLPKSEDKKEDKEEKEKSDEKVVKERLKSLGYM